MTTATALSIPLASEDVKITFRATCAFCETYTEGGVEGRNLVVPYVGISSLKLKSGWTTVQTDSGPRVWCGDCNPAS